MLHQPQEDIRRGPVTCPGVMAWLDHLIEDSSELSFERGERVLNGVGWCFGHLVEIILVGEPLGTRRMLVCRRGERHLVLINEAVDLNHAAVGELGEVCLAGQPMLLASDLPSR